MVVDAGPSINKNSSRDLTKSMDKSNSIATLPFNNVIDVGGSTLHTQFPNHQEAQTPTKIKSSDLPKNSILYSTQTDISPEFGRQTKFNFEKEYCKTRISRFPKLK